MTEQHPERPVDAFALAIYRNAHLSPADDSQVIALQFRDRLKELASQGSTLRAFVAYCADESPMAEAPVPDSAVVEAFRAARSALQGEWLATQDTVAVHRLLDGHLQKICACLSRELFAALERELDAGHIGQMQRVGDTIGRFRLPCRSRGSLFPSPMAAMTEDADSEEAPSTEVEFFIGDDVSFPKLGHRVRRLGSVQVFDKQATPALRQFLRLVTGKRYRAADDLAEGECSAVVLFHYVLDFWSDDDRRRPHGNAAAGGLLQRLQRLAPRRVSAPLVALIVLAACFFGLDYRRTTEVSNLERQVETLERRLAERGASPTPTEAAAPAQVTTLPTQVSDLERRLAALEEKPAEPSTAAEFQRIREAIDRLQRQTVRDESPPPAPSATAADVLALTERVAQIEAENREIRDGVRDATATLANLQRDAATAERLATVEQRSTTDVAALRKQIERLTSDLSTMQTDLATIRSSAVTAARLAEVTAEAAADRQRLRTDLDQLSTRHARAAERFDRLEKVLSGEAAGSSPALPVAQMRYQLQHTPSQCVIDDLHRLMESEEPYEKSNRAALLKERWNTLWSAAETVAYPTRATMLLEETMALSTCKKLDSDSRDKLVLEQAERLSKVEPSGEHASLEMLVAVTFNANKFTGTFNSYSTHGTIRQHLQTLIDSVGGFIEKQRLSAIKTEIGQVTTVSTDVSQNR